MANWFDDDGNARQPQACLNTLHTQNTRLDDIHTSCSTVCAAVCVNVFVVVCNASNIYICWCWCFCCILMERQTIWYWQVRDWATHAANEWMYVRCVGFDWVEMRGETNSVVYGWHRKGEVLQGWKSIFWYDVSDVAIIENRIISAPWNVF